MSRIITIGREFGSGGREFGKRLAEKLNCAYYDNEIVTEIAKRTDMAEEYIRRIVEERTVIFYPITVGRTFYSNVNAPVDLNNEIYVQQHKIITEMAQKNDCVIVGRCADYILRDLHPLRIFVCADMASKVERCRTRETEQEHESESALIRHIKSVDKNRSRYYRFFTGGKWGDKANYDLCINTSHIDVKAAAEVLAGMLSCKSKKCTD